MSDSSNTIETIANQEYKWGFVSDIEADSIPRGLNEDVIRLISAKKDEPEWLLDWRLKAYRHWLTMKEPTWANIHYPPIDYQDLIYYSAPKTKSEGLKSLEEVDPKLLETYEFEPFLGNLRKTQQIAIDIKRKTFRQRIHVADFCVFGHDRLCLFGMGLDEVDAFH